MGGGRLWMGFDGAVRWRIRLAVSDPEETVSGSSSCDDNALSTFISEYLSRIREYFDCSEACAVIALVYIDRVARCDSETAIGKLPFHQLLLACMVLAVKFHDDDYYCNAHYAAVGGMTSSELVRLETELVHALGWKVNVGLGEYELYRNELELYSALQRQDAQRDLTDCNE